MNCMSENSKDFLLFKAVTPDGELPEIKCDGVTFHIKDNAKGKGGGLYGIKKGHAKALFAVEAGTVTAKLGDETVFSQQFKSGFASVNNNIVTLITE